MLPCVAKFTIISLGQSVQPPQPPHLHPRPCPGTLVAASGTVLLRSPRSERDAAAEVY